MSNSSSSSNKFESFIKDKEKTTLKIKKQKNFSENMDLFIFKNVRQLSMGLVELINNTAFHGLDTLKVRIQAKCMVEDVALFYKNKVQHKPLICGVTSAGLGSFLSGYCFIYANDKFLHYFFRKGKDKSSFISNMDWKAKLISSYILADIVKVSIFLPFEARKQRIQMFHLINEIGMKNYSNYMMRAFLPMLLRDAIFRVITLGAFLKQLNVHHQPTLKYKLNDIKDYIRTKEKSGQKVNVSYFMDYSRFHIYSPFPTILLNLVFCSALATIITQPLDVIITKILTQTRLKYRGIISSYFIIVKEEGVKKLFLSGLSPRISFNTLSAMTVFIMYENINSRIKDFYEHDSVHDSNYNYNSYYNERL